MADIQTATALRVLCGYPSLGISLQDGLPPTVLAQPHILLIDAPFGYALVALTSLDAHPTLIISDNPCPDYWEDIWSMRPLAAQPCPKLCRRLSNFPEASVSDVPQLSKAH